MTACGVCRTDLHLSEGDLPPRRRGVIPGHQVVGLVAARGEDVTGLGVEQRVGIAWLRRTCGECRWRRSGAENLCPSSLYTGWDTDGGFAEYATVPAGFAYPLPEDVSDLHLAQPEKAEVGSDTPGASGGGEQRRGPSPADSC